LKKRKKSSLKKKLKEDKLRKYRKNLTEPVILDLIENMIQVIEKDLKIKFLENEKTFFKKDIHKEYQIINEEIGKIKTVEDLRESLSEIYKRLDFNLSEIIKNLGEVTTCSKGCGFCCHQRIGLSFPALSYLMSCVTEDHIEKAKKFVEADMQYGKPCIFLKDNSCSIYSNRPFPCRSYFSVQPKICCKEFYIDRKPSLHNNMPAIVSGYGQLFDSVVDFIFDSYGYQRIYDIDMAKLILKYNKESLKKWLNKETL